MTYKPEIHHRRSIRLKEYDYSQAGAYFITICCQDRACWFGEIKENIVGVGFTPTQTSALEENIPKIELNEYGQIAYEEWHKLAERFPNIELDVFQIMPNHLHGILLLNDMEQTGQPQGIAPTVGDIVGAYKSLVANMCLKICKSQNLVMGKLWQRNYYEHIIRDEKSYYNIANYILNNPANWAEDAFFKNRKIVF